MLLFGIPHKGMVVDDIAKMIADRDDHPRRALLQQINSESELLMLQLVDFKNLIRDRKIVSFYEIQQTRALTKVKKSKRRTVAVKDSANTDALGRRNTGLGANGRVPYCG